MVFKATLDITAKLMTASITLLFVMIAVGPGLLGKTGDTEIQIGVLLFLLVVYGITYAFSPLSYEVNETDLIIKRPFRNVVIPRYQIKNVFVLAQGKLTWSIRTFGVGGLFGYFGQFWNKEFGSMTWYVTRRNKTVMVITQNNKKIVLSPENAEQFVAIFSETNVH